MIDVAKFVQSMPRPFTWVRYLSYPFFFEETGCILDSCLLCILVYGSYFSVVFCSGTLLMTPERRRAIWAIYGNCF